MDDRYFLVIKDAGPICHVNGIKRTGKYTFARHSHPFWQSILVTEGTLTVITDQGERVLGAGSFHILPPGCSHALKSDGYRQIGIDFLDGTAELAALYDAFPEPTSRVSHRLTMYARQMEELDRSAPLADDIICTLAKLMLQTAASAALTDREDPLKSRILDYITEHSDTDFSLEEMAKAFHISVSHLERLCHSSFQCGIIALRNKMRCERALVLITQTDLPIREIGEMLGFSEPSNFSAFFKRFMGVSPAGYRRTYSDTTK